MAASRSGKVVAGVLLAVVVVAVAGAGVLVVFSARTGSSPDRSTDTVSSSLPDEPSKLAFLQRYMTLMSPVRATEFHIVFHDNGWAPSDWDFRAALKVEPGDVGLWTEGMAARSKAADFAWARALVPAGDVWEVSSAPTYYERGGCSLEVHAPEGVLFKECSTTRSH